MRALIGTHLPKILFLLALLPGVALTLSVYTADERRLQADFERSADLVVDRVVSRLQQHVVVLRAARGLLSATRGEMDRGTFVRFLSSIDISDRLSGVQGIGFARMLAVEDTAAAASEIRLHYGLDVTVRPDTTQSWRTPIVLLEPGSARNIAALGYDMYADHTRRSAIDHAIASGVAQMSGPVELVQEITTDKQAGFLVYLSVKALDRPPGTRTAPVSGFIYAPFRGRDLIEAALSAGAPLPVSLRITDTGSPDTPIFDNITAESDSSMQVARNLEILGRQWRFDLLASTTTSRMTRYFDSLLLALISLLFASATALAVSARQKEAVQANAVAQAAAREADYRALLLQEMKHRLKNHIARIQSIARQSARGATDVKAFSAAFDARLQAMATAQEILAGTALAQADVREMLVRELRQSLDAAEVDHLVDGPPVRLDERQAHAFALVVHELVTNAMKYGGLSSNGSGLQISWLVEPAKTSDRSRFVLSWVERFPAADTPPGKGSGFGSRLIDASLKGELSGTIEREFGPESLRIRISFPLSAPIPPAKKRG